MISHGTCTILYFLSMALEKLLARDFSAGEASTVYI